MFNQDAVTQLQERIQRKAIATPLNKQPISTAYIQAGKGGIPILLLHGFDSSLLEFYRLLPLLAAKNETWAIDLLGFGFTDRIKGLNFNPTTIKTHLYYCWKSLIDRPIILLGCSMGGAAAIDFTITYPQAVKKLILIDSVGYSGSFPFGKYLFPPCDYIAVEYWRQRKLQALNIVKLINSNSADLLALKSVTLHLEMPRWVEAMISFTKSGGYSWLGDKIAQIDKSTLIIWGESDETLGTEDAKKFQRDIAHSKLKWIKDCGHAPQLEQPEIVAEHILAFAQDSD